MSSDKPVRKRTRSSEKLTSRGTQFNFAEFKPSQSPTSDGPQLPPEDLAPPAGNEPRREGIPELDSASAKILPHTTDKDKSEEEMNTGSSAKETPLNGARGDYPAGNEDTFNGASNPTLEKSWEIIMKEVTSLDDGLVGGWKEDIDTLLVFAGLFSAVVTAFTIESYQWLQEASEDTTVALLKQISQQMNGTSVPESDTFAVSSSDVAINVLWFLSLIIALVDALFALLCKQWLREHRRHTHTRTPSEALALRWLRHQSLEKWRVPAILASLPILLELSLFLFLAGLLELLRTRHPVPFSIATIVVVFAAVFYFGTTIIPAIDIARQARQVDWVFRFSGKPLNNNVYLPVDFIITLPPMESICPYKSPQAWVVFQSLRLLPRILRPLQCATEFFWRGGCITPSTYYRLIGLFTPNLAFGHVMNNLSNWSSVDLELLQRADIELAPPFYELNTFRWLVAELRDSPHMVPHLRKILSTIPPHLVMPVVFDQWFFLPGRKWTVGDIETALVAPNLSPFGIEDHLTHAKHQFLAHGRETRLFNYLLHWIHVSMNGRDEKTDGSRDSQDLFPAPFRSIDAAMPDDCLHLWDLYCKIAQDPAVPYYYWGTLMEDLAPYIIASSPDYALHLPTATTTSQGMDWMEAVDILRRVHNLPENHFKPFPGHFSLPVTKLGKTLNSPSPTDPGNDFQYLDEFSKGWGDANEQNKSELVNILSQHIKHYPQSDAEPSHCPDKSNISPLVMSSAGLELITFVNDRLAGDSEIYGYLLPWTRTGWRDAVEQVRAARPELPRDHFKNIFHEGVDPPPPREPTLQQEVEVEPPARDSGDSPRDVTNGVNHDEMNVPPISVAKPSPQPEPGELDERHPLDDGDTDEKGSISRQPVVTGNPGTASGSTGVQGEKMVGGPDADKNV